MEKRGYNLMDAEVYRNYKDAYDVKHAQKLFNISKCGREGEMTEVKV